MYQEQVIKKFGDCNNLMTTLSSDLKYRLKERPKTPGLKTKSIFEGVAIEKKEGNIKM